MATHTDNKFPIVCFGDDWGRYQTSNQHLMRAFAALGHRVVWVNSIGARAPRCRLDDLRKVVWKVCASRTHVEGMKDNPIVVSPLSLPLPQFRWARELNVRRIAPFVRSVLQQADIRPPVLWICGPVPADFIGRLGERASIYYCADEYAALPNAPARVVEALEADALKRADLTVVVSKALLARKASRADRVVLVPHGVDIDHFEQALDDELPIPAEVASLPRPIVMLMGAVDAWTDTALIAHISQTRPDWSVVVVGRLNVKGRDWMHSPNVHCLGPRAYDGLPAYLRAAQVGILPYRVNQQTLNCNPLKLREYLAAGVPVVAVSIPEVECYAPLVHTARTPEEFVAAIEGAIETDSPTRRQARHDAVARESWRERAEWLSSQIEDLL